MPPGRARRPASRGGANRHPAEYEGRRLALAAVFEAEFGQRTATAALERVLGEDATPPAAAELARAIVGAVVAHRDRLDARIAAAAPAYPVLGLARIDRALLRSALGEVLHCPATPKRVAISEWVELARTYSGEPARRLVNGVLGRVASEVAGSDPGDSSDQTADERPVRPPDRPAGGST